MNPTGEPPSEEGGHEENATGTVMPPGWADRAGAAEEGGRGVRKISALA